MILSIYKYLYTCLPNAYTKLSAIFYGKNPDKLHVRTCNISRPLILLVFLFYRFYLSSVIYLRNISWVHATWHFGRGASAIWQLALGGDTWLSRTLRPLDQNQGGNENYTFQYCNRSHCTLFQIHLFLMITSLMSCSFLNDYFFV